MARLIGRFDSLRVSPSQGCLTEGETGINHRRRVVLALSHALDLTIGRTWPTGRFSYLASDPEVEPPSFANGSRPLGAWSWTTLANRLEHDDRVGEGVWLQLAELDLWHLHV